jgi:hypothetical protein
VVSSDLDREEEIDDDMLLAVADEVRDRLLEKLFVIEKLCEAE